MVKICSKCLISKYKSAFSKRKYSVDGYRSECKICANIARKKYYNENKENSKVKSLEYYNKNKSIILIKNSNYNKENRCKRNLLAKNYRIKNKHILAWRYMINNSLKRLGKPKEGKTIDLLGYSALDLYNHMIPLFLEGMSWDNHGEWHIDHIKPVSSFDKDTPMNIVNALSNLQPLWAGDNLSKSNN